ncbi:hypothetical protein [Aquibacillus rhizosphaerae]|uniref:HEPN AbiU2-like domain-containing protein n=1 Tax=Aquibacillus rhizosphaerae TaxID=3051431 RepID=A0ABT7L6Z1_9BACI|nr:hypothetical protein [Aquibacillus sp. LR5S19]MDL4840355.1 hypothetical protein [Aquibacillus sp. LR5S19]
MPIFNENVLKEQLYILRDFLFHYESYRQINRSLEKLKNLGSQEFWVYTANAHYYQAINLWCMVFGTYNNETHYKKLGITKDLKAFIYSELKLNKDEYSYYWKKVTDWRNNHSAHRLPGRLDEVPELKMARNIVFVFEKWLKQNSISVSDIIIGFSFQQYEKEFKRNLDITFEQLDSI